MPWIDEIAEETDYQTALEKIYGRAGAPIDSVLNYSNSGVPMSVKTGSIDQPRLPLAERKVMLMRDHVLKFPELFFSVYVSGPSEDTRGMAQLFVRAGCVKANTPAEADLVVFTGGPDVDPAYYGARPHACTYGCNERDQSDLMLYLECLDQGIPMTGICRGAQFLAVMNGFSLYQHVNGHQGDHQIWDVRDKIMVDSVSSVHHQMVIPGKGMEIVATAAVSTERHLDDDRVQRSGKPFMDLEAYFLRDTCCFGVQGHPEYRGYDAYAKWYLDKLYQYISLNVDVQSKDGRLRLTDAVLKERDSVQNIISEIGEKG